MMLGGAHRAVAPTSAACLWSLPLVCCGVVVRGGLGLFNPLQDLHPPSSNLLQPNRLRPFHALRNQASASLGRLWLADESNPEDPFRSMRSSGLPESVVDDFDGLGVTIPVTCGGGAIFEGAVKMHTRNFGTFSAVITRLVGHRGTYPAQTGC